MKLVTYDDGRVGKVVDGTSDRARRADMRELLRARRRRRATPDARRRWTDVRLRRRRSSRRSSSTPRATSASITRSPRASTGHTRCCPGSCSSRTSTPSSATDEPIIYPEGMTNELDYELELAVDDRQGGQVLLARGGRGLHRRLYRLQRHHRPRHPARGDEVRGVLPVQEHRHVLPDRPVDRHRRRDPRSRRTWPWSCGSTARSRQTLAHEPDVGDRPGDHQPLLGHGLQRPATSSPPAPWPASPASARTRRRSTSSRGTWSRPRSRASACCATRSSRGPRATRDRIAAAAGPRRRAASRPHPVATVDRRRSAGRCAGRPGHGGLAFLGIPYASAPRFAPPGPAPAGRACATRPRPGRPPPSRARPVARFTHGEPPRDRRGRCLNLNVFTPAPDGARPVLVWHPRRRLRDRARRPAIYDGARLAAAADASWSSAQLPPGQPGLAVPPGAGVERGGPRATGACWTRSPRCGGCATTSRPSAATRRA